ncbi:hypothetical protein GOP47_0010416 [Adiantum capillus-veneris]|uniref:Uncharacterized protein n=1 Tax=Adiantum capillus-veneris TaxID=13818 RepID=A0A9D4ZIR5_ADICA|nr:hypothetical protein GOP47_0010416 [Adiantum capillus-veneris]
MVVDETDNAIMETFFTSLEEPSSAVDDTSTGADAENPTDDAHTSVLLGAAMGTDANSADEGTKVSSFAGRDVATRCAADATAAKAVISKHLAAAEALAVPCNTFMQ